MKKNLLYLLTVMMTMMLDVGLSSCSNDNDYNDEDETDSGLKVQYPIEINATNFPDDNFRNYLLEQDYGEDGILTEEEIKDIEEMYVDESEISSLQGIENFTALTRLDCYYNQLTALDVSKNTALKMLRCYHNLLTALDVSKNTALDWLDCEDNYLSTLDVSRNTALTWLDCANNYLSTLDVSKNTALTSLYCHTNQLTALDVSKCTALTTLVCYNNQLTALDVSWNSALDLLNCGDNYLSTLDVSRNTALTWLNCYNNYLSTLDVSKNTALTTLDCCHNQLTNLDVSKNTALTTLDCHNNQIKEASMDNLINSLPTQEKAHLYVYSSVAPNEGNVCTKEQVQAAKEKGWRVLYERYYYDKYGGLWYDYEGSDDTAIDGIRMEAGKDAPIYNRLTAPQKDVNIIDGRKVVVK